VIVSLLYLALQIRQYTRSVRASTYQAFSESFRDLRNLLVGDERLGTIWIRGLRSRPDLSAAERAQFDALLMNFLRGVEVSSSSRREPMGTVRVQSTACTEDVSRTI